MGVHFKRGPSGAKKRMKCPGSEALAETLPPHQRNVGSEAGRIGTVVHALIERSLGEGAQPADYLDYIVELVGPEETIKWYKPTAKEPNRGNHWYIINDDMVESATICTDYVRERCEELGVPESEVQTESRTNPLPDRDDTPGTADLHIDAWPIEAETIDYKNGGITVEHNANPQLLCYGAGKAEESGFVNDTYRLTIVQPNATHEEGRIRSYVVTREELKAFQVEYRAALARCEQAEADFEAIDAAGPYADQAYDDWAAEYLCAGDWCTFCDAQPICPARRRMVQDTAKMDFADPPRRLEVDRTKLAHVLLWAPEIDNFLRRCTAFAQREMENGHDVGGQKLVERGTVRKLRGDMTQAEIVAAIIRRGFVADRKRLYSTKLKSGPQIEKIVDRKRKKEFAAEFLTRPPGKLMVAPIDDPRPAVIRSAADDFDDDFAEFG